MDEEKYQKELFPFEPAKKTFSRLSDILPKADFEGKVAVTLTLENMVFIAIGIVMAMVIVYALGVESGKSRKRSDVVTARQIIVPPPAVQARAAMIGAKNILNTAPVVPSTKPVVMVKPAAKTFTILVGSYAKREGAQITAAVLVKLGFTVTITYSAPYYRVSAGSYTDKSGADSIRDMAKIKRIYKDAMFKLR